MKSEQTDVCEGRSVAWTFGAPALLLLVALLAIPSVDLTISSWVSKHQLRGDVSELMHVAETFGHGVGVLLILILIWFINDPLRRELPRLFAASIGAGLAADVVKLLISRHRPRAMLASMDTAWSTFGEFFPLLQGGTAVQSFPSAHSATAVGLACGLTVLFPRARWYFTALATLTCISRVHVLAHFPSDVFAGAAVGIVVARFAMQFRRPVESPVLLPFERYDENVEIRRAA